jgi:glutathione S-transferase
MRLYDYAASCNAYKVRLLIAQLALDVERVEVDIFAGETLTDGFGALNPSRTVPVLQLDDGRTLPESAAILWYLADGSPLLPDDRWTRAEVLRWLVWEQTDFVPGVGGLRFRLQTGRWAPDDPAAVARRDAGRQALDLLDRHLATRAFVAGESYTIADIALYGYAHVAGEAGFALEDLPGVDAWLRRVAAQDGHVDDVQPYPANARPGAGRSIYG